VATTTCRAQSPRDCPRGRPRSAPSTPPCAPTWGVPSDLDLADLLFDVLRRRRVTSDRATGPHRASSAAPHRRLLQAAAGAARRAGRSTYLWQHLLRDGEANAPRQRLRFTGCAAPTPHRRDSSCWPPPALIVPAHRTWPHRRAHVYTSASMATLTRQRGPHGRGSAPRTRGGWPQPWAVRITVRPHRTPPSSSSARPITATPRSMRSTSSPPPLPGDLADAFALSRRSGARHRLDDRGRDRCRWRRPADSATGHGAGRAGRTTDANHAIARALGPARAGGRTRPCIVAVTNPSGAAATPRLEVYAMTSSWTRAS